MPPCTRALLYSVASTTCLTSARMKRHNSFNHFKIKVIMESFANVSNLYQVADIELIYKSKVQASQPPQIESSPDAHNVLMQMWNPDRLELIEEFKIIPSPIVNRSQDYIPKRIFRLTMKGWSV